MVPGNDATISGKKALPFLSVGCLVFAVGMGFLTWEIARLSTPYFQRLEKERRIREGRAPKDVRASLEITSGKYVRR